MKIVIELSPKELKLVRQALKVWRGDFYASEGFQPSLVWQKELSELIDKLEKEE